ncbi:MAG: hypothetical protein ACI8QC_001978 [Planctomycetota bacterium]|jgi:hypothetical protein
MATAAVQDEAAPERPGFLSYEEGDPELVRGLRQHKEGASDGYILMAPLNAETTYLLDREGEVVHSWPTDSSPGGGTYLLENGNLLRCGREDDKPAFRGGGIGGRLQLIAPDGTLLWNWRLADENQHQHHDVEPLPNGNVLLISWERLSQRDAMLAGRDKNQVGKAGLWPDMVLEVKPVLPDGAEIVWEWHVMDHLVQDANEDRLHFGYPADHPGLVDINVEHRDAAPLSAAQRKSIAARNEGMEALGYVGGDEEPDDEDLAQLDKSGDWMHTNAIAYDAEYDLIMLSSPELNEIFIIDHSTTTAEAATNEGGRYGHGGDLLWRYGNPRNYGAGTDSDKRLWYQHNPSFLRGPDGDLRVLVYNNGSGRPDKSYSSVEELVLPFDPESGFQLTQGAAYGPSQPAWSYSNPEGFYSAFISGCERLPGGNTLICSGAAGHIFEVTPDGEVVWDYYNTLGGEITPPDHAGKAPPKALFRALHYGTQHAGVRKLLGR